MRLDTQWDILAALPYLAAGAGLAWLSVTLVLRQAHHLRRRRKAEREAAERQSAGPTPWNDWLRDINEQHERATLDLDRMKGKWRE